LEEVSDEGAGEAVVDALLLFGEYLIVLWAHAVKFFKGVLIDVVVHLASHQFLE
jgi:hypothetical protein